jgi:hypothetical protein
MRAGVLIVALAVSTLAVAPASADIKRSKDHKAGVTFRLNSTHLSMKLSDQVDPRAAKKLLGKRVTAACGTKKTGGKVYYVTFEWPVDRSSFAVDLKGDISAKAAYCLLETVKGSDIAVVEFK